MSQSDSQASTSPANPYWKAVTVSGFLFVATTLAIVMVPFSEQKSPVNTFLRKNGDWLAALEVGAVLISGVMAMAVDQRQTREAREASSRTNAVVTPPLGQGEVSDVG